MSRHFCLYLLGIVSQTLCQRVRGESEGKSEGDSEDEMGEANVKGSPRKRQVPDTSVERHKVHLHAGSTFLFLFVFNLTSL